MYFLLLVLNLLTFPPPPHSLFFLFFLSFSLFLLPSSGLIDYAKSFDSTFSSKKWNQWGKWKKKKKTERNGGERGQRKRHTSGRKDYYSHTILGAHRLSQSFDSVFYNIQNCKSVALYSSRRIGDVSFRGHGAWHVNHAADIARRALKAVRGEFDCYMNAAFFVDWLDEKKSKRGAEGEKGRREERKEEK